MCQSDHIHWEAVESTHITSGAHLALNHASISQWFQHASGLQVRFKSITITVNIYRFFSTTRKIQADMKQSKMFHVLQVGEVITVRLFPGWPGVDWGKKIVFVDQPRLDTNPTGTVPDMPDGQSTPEADCDNSKPQNAKTKLNFPDFSFQISKRCLVSMDCKQIAE